MVKRSASTFHLNGLLCKKSNSFWIVNKRLCLCHRRYWLQIKSSGAEVTVKHNWPKLPAIYVCNITNVYKYSIQYSIFTQWKWWRSPCGRFSKKPDIPLVLSSPVWVAVIPWQCVDIQSLLLLFQPSWLCCSVLSHQICVGDQLYFSWLIAAALSKHIPCTVAWEDGWPKPCSITFLQKCVCKNSK